MDDRIYKHLADHMRRTLEGHQEPYQPGAWEAFERNRQPAPRHGFGWLRYATAACLFAGLLLAPLWLDEDWRLLKVPGPQSQSGVASLQPTHRPEAPPTRLVADSAVAVVLSASTQPAAASSAGDDPPIHRSQEATLNDLPPVGANPPSPARLEAVRAAGSPRLDLRSKRATLPADALPAVATHGAEVKSELLERTAESRHRRFADIPAMPLPSVSVREFVESPAAPAAEPKPTRRGIVTWSLALSPQTAYVANGRSALSMGGGMVSDIALGGRFSLSTGLSVAQQMVGVAQTVYQVMATTTPVRQRTGTDARLVLIDLPLNLTYQAGKAARPAFRFSAGLSSLAFVSQRYTDSYQIVRTQVVQGTDQQGRPQPTVQTMVSNEVEIRAGGAFGGVYWGRLLNLSVTLERPLTQRAVVAVEPYIKYPLGSFTEERLSIGSVGVNLRVGIR